MTVAGTQLDNNDQVGRMAPRPVAYVDTDGFSLIPVTLALPMPVAGAVTVTGGVSAVTEDAAAAANPAGPQIMARRKDTLSASEVSADGDHIALNATAMGQLHVFSSTPFGQPATPWSYAAAASGILNTATAVTFIAAAGAGVRNYISAFQIMWEALGTATELAIRDGAGGTVLWRMKIPASLAGLREVVLPVPIRSSANTLLEVVTLTASTTGAVYFNAQGYQAA